MPDTDPPRDFLSLPTRDYPSENGLGDLGSNPVQPALETLFSEFARRHRSLSPSTQSSPRSARGQTRHSQEHTVRPPAIDLHALEYASEYDSHLMCPICHLPFVEPVVLDCDHTFCASCFDEYKRGTNSNEPARCPSCRSYLLSNPRKASRLIYNMCNDLKVQCPNEGCSTLVARGSIERHVAKDCLEQQLPCPDSKCEKQTKRKNYVSAQCIHNTHIECDCGAIIELGRGEYLRHKDESCPNTGVQCEKCGDRMRINDFLSRDRNHVCSSLSEEPSCPGREFGCTSDVSADDLPNHVSACPLARLASHLKTQSRLLQSLQDQLTTSKLRNETLEVEVEHLNHVLTSEIQPRLDQLAIPSGSSDAQHEDADHDVEEIPRDTIPSAAAIHHRDLLLPAHVRDLTPSPEFLASQNGHSHGDHGHYHPSSLSAHNHLLALHEALRHTVTGLEADINTLHNTIAELDARTSMQLMNETLRIKEELAHTNAAMFSNRSQVQWLLNRERIGREQAIMRERERGRVGNGSGGGQLTGGGPGGHAMQRQPSNESSGAGSAPMISPGANIQHQLPQQHQHQHQQYESFPFHSTNATGGSGPSSTATSPMFTGIGVASGSAGSTRRPSMRGGSQERVKL